MHRLQTMAVVATLMVGIVATMEAAVEVGVRALRDGLSRHLAEVRKGHTVTVTDHGRAIARIVPVGTPTALERLVAEGRVRPATRRKADRRRAFAEELAARHPAVALVTMAPLSRRVPRMHPLHPAPHPEGGWPR